jgi:hypothetical protein
MRTGTWIVLGVAPLLLVGLWAGADALHAQEGSPAAQEEPAPAGGQDEPASPAAGELGADRVARGEYLVHGIAMCQECHTPRDEEGELVLDQLLMGAAMPVLPPAFVDRWGRRAPAIAGLPGYSDEDAVRLLTQGVTRRGTLPRPPMPKYRFSEDDARAVIAYLRSL